MSDNELLLRRKANFDQFFQDLMPCLVHFMGALGINPAHEVLHHAEQYEPLVSAALRDMAVDNQEDRQWLVLRMTYFVGEYFAQKFSGHWLVNERITSKSFARYVVGNFALPAPNAALIDSAGIAMEYVASGWAT